ncbi:unnamed protein product [Paramecium sonneborni]|uniref:Pyrophosphate--fructose 6-phosphate 1-phosphotransferase n=1 Tax=Paramecium sonneborni TaxID=65129 RepID=A0A8S1PX12_9CILI|nr:unnamed protein product [Paramecium sonneborni]
MIIQPNNFHSLRTKYQPELPQLLQLDELDTKTETIEVNPQIREMFPFLCKDEVKAVTFQAADANENTIRAPLRIGCVLSGGQAAGGHNVIVGIYEQIKRRHPNSQLFGFLKGPIGIYTGKYEELKDDTINYFKNRGGFDMIQSGRHKIETEEQFKKSLQYCQSLKLDGLVVIGGDDSNTNACLLAEYFLKNNCQTCVVGCPKTIDGDLKNEFVEVSFGFDTACKTYSELIGNIMLDTVSSKKYYHFIRLMGRSASHIALECALLTRPTWAYIGEEVEKNKTSLTQIVTQLSDLIEKRYKQNKNHGVILVPEGLIEFIDEVKILIKEINSILASNKWESDQVFDNILTKLTPESSKLLQFLPRSISDQLLLDRDPHGNVQVAKIETEKLLIEMVKAELIRRKYAGKFSAISHYYGYEGRCAFPTKFDCDYCYSLGVNAAILIENKFTGVMSCIRNLHQTPSEWNAAGFPLVTMMDVETRKGKSVPVIKKALVDLQGPLFKFYQSNRDKWAFHDYYHPVGPIQFEGDQVPPFLINGKGFEFEEVDNKIYQQKPYEEMHLRNLSKLGLERSNTPLALPKHLNLKLSLKVIHHNYTDNVTKSIEKHFSSLMAKSINAFQFVHDDAHEAHNKPLRIAITLNGRQSPGANCIIRGLLALCEQSGSTLYGFIGGTQGLFKQEFIEINQNSLQYYINQGGYHYLGRTADKMRTVQELQKVKETCNSLQLDGLVVVGASHTLTDCLIVANYLLQENIKTRVIGVPCTVDNNIGHPFLEGIVGFDTASKTYSQMIGNIMIDAASAVKYWYFIRLMGRDPSHLVLECALQTHPNVVLISEDIKERGLTLQEVVSEIADVVVLRSQKNKEFGTVLVPEGLLAHIGQFKQLITELDKHFTTSKQEILNNLTPWSAALFQSLPDFTQQQLLMEREVHGGIQLSQIETERLLAHLVAEELKVRKAESKYKGSFSPICHFFGYQGRCAFPTRFDAKLGEVYGYLAGLSIQRGLTGYCVSARGIAGPIERWHFNVIPLLGMLSIKQKSAYGEAQPVIASYEVDLKQALFKHFSQISKNWYLKDHYENPGPIQFYGPMARKPTLTVELSYKCYVDQIEEIERLVEVISEQCRFETRADLLDLAIAQLKALAKTIEVVKEAKQ